ncbi:hypothetical protein GCM10011502_00530 [Oceanisphaera marina]|uniref:Uncharacterized protein n=1 Tax=Oceanisphaera marina TaxID=2017550 RepID=A0ABQ1IC85_9GAMM|nr:hypothetical protein [Oceanisphaera marina]GGB31468.1 hypothetical protein GCM10011502_00530 [Oceanisphaera marina]
MKPTDKIFWRWQSQPQVTPIKTAFVTITDDDIASQVIRQIPDDRD